MTNKTGRKSGEEDKVDAGTAVGDGAGAAEAEGAGTYGAPSFDGAANSGAGVAVVYIGF